MYRLAEDGTTIEVSRTIVFPANAGDRQNFQFFLPGSILPSCSCAGSQVSPQVTPTGGTGTSVLFSQVQLRGLAGKVLDVSFCLPNAVLEKGIAKVIRDRIFVFVDVSSLKASLRFGKPFVRTRFSSKFRPAKTDFDAGVVEISDGSAPQPPGMVVINIGCEFVLSSSITVRAQAGKALDVGMPILSGLSKRAGNELQGKRIVVILHFLDDLLPFAEAMLRRGADPDRVLFLAKDYPYPSKEIVKVSLQNWGFHVADWEVAENTERRLVPELAQFFGIGEEPILILEDGGYIVPLTLSEKSLKPFVGRVLGAVEQTTNGLRRVEDALLKMGQGGIRGQREVGQSMRLPFPYLNVAGCEIKRRYEPSFVAEAGVRNIQKLLGDNATFRGRRVIVIGGGAIGTALVGHFVTNKAAVYLVEKSPLRKFIAHSDQGGVITAGKTLREMVEQAEGDREPNPKPLIIVGTTGSQSVKASDTEYLPTGSILVSMSSKQVEFDLAGFEQLSGTRPAEWSLYGFPIGWTYIFQQGGARKEIHVLGQGYPINFVGTESVENSRIDPIMSLLFASLLEVANPTYLPHSDGTARDRTPPQAFWLVSASLNIYTDFVDWMAEQIGMFDDV